MWALVDDADNVTEIIAHPKSLIIDDIRHPKKIFSAWTDAEKRAIGLYEVTPASKFDENYYVNSNASYAKVATKVVETITKVADKKLTDTNEVDENGDPLLDDDGVQVVTLGLKSNAKNKATTQSSAFLKGFGWLIQRKVTASVAIPSAVTTYMAAIRTDHGNICTALDAAANMNAFIALHTTTYNEDRTVNVIAKTQSWTSDTNVKAYRR
tara:strand:- start:1432 stop:2064 length:633 start_codon:yes stop_codon:yes gene_type:complete